MQMIHLVNTRESSNFFLLSIVFFLCFPFLQQSAILFWRARWTMKFSDRVDQNDDDQPMKWMKNRLPFTRSILPPSMYLPCETTRIVEKLTLSSKRAAWNRSIYGPWGLRVQVLPPPLHATWRKYSAIGTVMFNMRPVYINYWTGEGQAFTCAQDRNALCTIDDRTECRIV